MDKVYSISEFAERVNVSISTLRRWDGSSPQRSGPAGIVIMTRAMFGSCWTWRLKKCGKWSSTVEYQVTDKRMISPRRSKQWRRIALGRESRLTIGSRRLAAGWTSSERSSSLWWMALSQVKWSIWSSRTRTGWYASGSTSSNTLPTGMAARLR